MGWSDKKTVGGISVYDVSPTVATTKNGAIALGMLNGRRRVWKPTFAVVDGTEVEVFVPVGIFQTKKCEMWAVVRMPDGSVSPWHVVGKPEDEEEGSP